MAFLADHKDDLALIIELRRFRWTDQLRAVPNEGSRRTKEQARIFGQLRIVFVFVVAVGVVDADAENLLGRHHRWQQFNLGQRQIRTDVFDRFSHLVQRTGAHHFQQGVKARHAEADVDHGVAQHHAIARPAAMIETGEFHSLVSLVGNPGNAPPTGLDMAPGSVGIGAFRRLGARGMAFRYGARNGCKTA